MNASRTRESTVIVSNVACAGSRPGRISTNSSPPSRATVSPSRAPVSALPSGEAAEYTSMPAVSVDTVVSAVQTTPL